MSMTCIERMINAMANYPSFLEGLVSLSEGGVACYETGNRINDSKNGRRPIYLLYIGIGTVLQSISAIGWRK